MTKKIDLAIVGAGPHALTLITHLLQKRQSMRTRFSVFDSSGMWMSRWKRQFAALEIPHLRSPAVHHPDPNPFALRKFAESRPRELFAPYDFPGTRLFEDFCQEVIKVWQLQDQVIPLAVRSIEPLCDFVRSQFRLCLQDGQEAIARRVVLATNSAQIQIPDWVNQIQTAYPPDRLYHSQTIDLRKLQLRSKRVLIVGGGLTSGHLAVGAISRGAKVHLLLRRNLAEKLFDAEAGWLGPKYLKDFFAQSDWQLRFTMIQQARNGGSMTPAIATQLRRQVRSGNIRIDENCQIIKAQWLGENWCVQCSDGSQHECDYIWLSTGTKFDVTTEPLLKDILKAYPIPIVKGLPVLDTCLRWPGCELFIMGGIAALQVGPTARNLSGARMACEKIVPAIVKPSVALSHTFSGLQAS
ncbi:lysine N(6)-hydroxylase/L-ornithine N(5)-oxygenase family protein [Aetokthonos hydrillicola Thurmond2011]|jgi:cation diffusion facilitator CzcD-associated flavoprotein CzcO|uniref:Lysine N(6)-hydroxylase/L-ornithine N(5)-oxygenase family protein n=1 Tax=Aetokthonos hydrillicola Thurmond2011 TaxID=2712845 RepID=A0AAP5I4Q4_9CYAN|nr:FAD/NAD(P)-binding protein [Aetokthonos hydrillicola]MBO3457416.1 lysine N(6)-hydroxylase/L-ornithine N(5)-oxygenase family protein [Aetokthonos hydrillicola CCALA 1050]MBW4589443.1 lysine N(6)-hydroxylase/L-ornithine N(5)-oxygenase family protein [Aetokthonos hydrillicola CCALA 1050]MDR9893712.1 lysine N(6)-hydroxylase/L-ornithine N(5)-oxygenase family protein [Aetokthonos hydrillicola Thurmond2011]